MPCGDGMSVSSEKTGSTCQHRCGCGGTGAGQKRAGDLWTD